MANEEEIPFIPMNAETVPTMTEIMDGLPPILTVDEMANLLRVSVDQVWTLCKNGQLKAFKAGKYWRIMKEDAKNFMGM